MVERPSKGPGSPFNSTDVSSNPGWHKVVGKILATLSVEHRNKHAIWESNTFNPICVLFKPGSPRAPFYSIQLILCRFLNLSLEVIRCVIVPLALAVVP